jgi:hypothetical protein
MSVDPAAGSSADDLASNADQEEGLSAISDPDDYALRRRLKQLHDARDRVVETKQTAVRIETLEREFTELQRDRLVHEDLLDYILELKAVLGREDQGRDIDEFLSETVGDASVNDVETLTTLLNKRGQDPPPYHISMQAWDICNSYLEELAGADLDTGLPEETLQACE